MFHGLIVLYMIRLLMLQVSAACISPAAISHLGLCVCRWLAVVVHLSAMVRVRAREVVSMRVMASAGR